jgi:hypothetical protein
MPAMGTMITPMPKPDSTFFGEHMAALISRTTAHVTYPLPATYTIK